MQVSQEGYREGEGMLLGITTALVLTVITNTILS